MKYGDQKMYRTFEEFEREEMRRTDGFSAAMEDMLGEMIAEELGFEARPSRRRDDDDE